MRIFVDADACPVKEEIVKIAKRYQLSVIMVLDTSHVYHDGYSQVITVDQEKDSADMKLMNLMQSEDLVVTQDYGVAAMALGKGALAVSQNGFAYDDQNIDRLLLERHLSQKARRAGKRGGKNRKRTADDDALFETVLETLIKQRLQGDEIEEGN